MTEDKNTGQPDEETHVMSHEEVKDYAGLTLNEQGEEEGRAEENSYIRVKTIHLNELPWWKKIAGLAVIFAPRKKKEADADETIHHCLAEPPAGLSGEPPGPADAAAL